MLFHVVEGAFVVLRRRGLYKQAKVYRRGEALYAGVSGGFVALMGSGGTSAPDMLWDDLVTDLTITKGPFGRPQLAAPQAHAQH